VVGVTFFEFGSRQFGGGYKMRNGIRIFWIIAFFALAVSQTWAGGSSDSSSNRIHPGAKMILEARGYKFDSNGNLTGFGRYTVQNFPNMNETNTNPHAYEKNVVYITDFDVNQWVNQWASKNILATTGSETARQQTRALFSVNHDLYTLGVLGGMNTSNGTRIYIKNIPKKFQKEINGPVQNAFLLYTGTQTLRMTDGSSQLFPVFQLNDLFDNTLSQAISDFNKAFDKGIYKEEDGYQYSRINRRTFGRDKATKKELLEWNGSQWINLIGG